MQATLAVVALLVSCIKYVAEVAGAEDVYDLQHALPVHDEHYLDYIVMLLDEGAPDFSKHETPEEREEDAEAAVRHDARAVSEAQQVLVEAEKNLGQEKKKVSEMKATASKADKLSSDDEGRVETARAAQAADQKKADHDTEAEEAAAAKVKTDKIKLKEDKNNVARRERIAKEATADAQKKLKAAEHEEKHEVDLAATKEKDQVAVSDDKGAEDQAKLRETVDEVELNKHISTHMTQKVSAPPPAASSTGSMVAIP